jgi:hypothetical protein
MSETFCGKSADAAEKWHIFQPFSIFQRSVTHFRVQGGIRTPSHCNQGRSLLCTCVQFQHSSLHCFGVYADLQNIVKIEGVP